MCEKLPASLDFLLHILGIELREGNVVTNLAIIEELIVEIAEPLLNASSSDKISIEGGPHAAVSPEPSPLPRSRALTTPLDPPAKTGYARAIQTDGWA
jgi:hypothetical protein